MTDQQLGSASGIPTNILFAYVYVALRQRLAAIMYGNHPSSRSTFEEDF
jgi:hypothetical protein